MKLKVLLSTLVFVSVLVSCTPNKPKDLTTTEQISQLEALLFSENSQYNMDDATRLLTLYVRYADSLPSDSLAPEYLFKAADISMYQSDDKRTITLLDRVITEYADYEKASTCLFLKAFVYDTKVGDTSMAHKFYDEFIQQYPDNDFTVDARSAIRNLGKPLDELIKEFELQNQ